MKMLSSLILGSLLLTSSIQAQDFGFNLGPFSMQFNVGSSYYAKDHMDILDAPICNAISNQKQLDVIVESKEKINSKEVRMTTKRLTIEPYAFGVTLDGKPVLNGNIISEKLIKEVTVKFGEEMDGDNGNWSNDKKEGFFSGWFKTEKNKTIDLEKISNLYVINNSHFDAPKDYKGLNDANIRVICQLPIAK